jgi:AraC-like DNA-binding protein
MTDVALDYRVPPEDLQPYVTLFYNFRADVPMFEDVERADHAQLRFRLSPGTATYDFPDGSRQDAPALHVVGATTGAIRTRAEGPLLVVGMGLQPAGWAALLGVDASTMLNRALDGVAAFGPAIVEAADQMRAAADVDARVAIAASFVRQSITAAGSRWLAFARQVDAWLAGSPSPDLDELVAATGLSRRQVERRCNALYGAPPKVLARKYRALRAASALNSGSATLDELLADGFYDQPHLIREVKRFTGMTPRQMRDQPGLLAQLTISQRNALHGQVHPIISDT